MPGRDRNILLVLCIQYYSCMYNTRFFKVQKTSYSHILSFLCPSSIHLYTARGCLCVFIKRSQTKSILVRMRKATAWEMNGHVSRNVKFE